MKINKLGKTAAAGTIMVGILLFLAVQGASERLAPRNWQPTDANPRLLVTPLEVWEHRDQWLVVDLRDRESYLAGHLPGAIHLGDRAHKLLRTDMFVPDFRREESPRAGEVYEHLAMQPVAELERVFSRAGISHGQTVVLYSDYEDTLPGYTFVPFVVLEYLGHPDVRVMDGGIENWWAHRLPVETRENRLPPSNFRTRLRPQVIADETEVLSIALMNLAVLDEMGIDDRRIDMPQLVDSRIADEHSGAQPAPPGHALYEAGARAGRIPQTTVNVPHWQQFADMETLLLKPIPELAAMYAALDREKRTIVYCYIANRASMTYFILRLLGFNDPAVYHDSWIVWGNNPQLPLAFDRGVSGATTPRAGGYQ
ncbi:sulfurtransferase [Desulfurivibrio dismutans]|uniref:sulfurtransferase n=1 Tax=Desulfurivibrio dismutans TaxID=1398908 RepID=UPI0023DCBBF2|nr:rhodanese-like domain-containing protein [Desulfurivibrio alkaliphilus]MDF1613783.1 rhodanese-like domain-containing protein [Desulfurivibrio alkaliphilus]